MTIDVSFADEKAEMSISGHAEHFAQAISLVNEFFESLTEEDLKNTDYFCFDEGSFSRGEKV